MSTARSLARRATRAPRARDSVAPSLARKGDGFPRRGFTSGDQILKKHFRVISSGGVFGNPTNKWTICLFSSVFFLFRGGPGQGFPKTNSPYGGDFLCHKSREKPVVPTTVLWRSMSLRVPLCWWCLKPTETHTHTCRFGVPETKNKRHAHMLKPVCSSRFSKKPSKKGKCTAEILVSGGRNF